MLVRWLSPGLLCVLLRECVWWAGLLVATGFEQERACWDPKDGELCLNRVKPEETLVEARSGSDVQIDRQIWV